MIMLNKETKDEIHKCHEITGKIDKKIEKHIEWGQKEDTKIKKAFADHDMIMQKIMAVLPEKGFCEKVSNNLELDKEITLSDKVEILWNDRRWVKAILYILVALAAGNSAMLVNLMFGS